MNPSETLRACPLCGGWPEFGYVDDAESPDHGGHFLQCTTAACGMSVGLIYNNGEDPKPLLAERWNRRTPAPALARSAEQVIEGFTRDDLAHLARVFGRGCDLRDDRDRRVNEWLKAALKEAASNG